MDNTLFELSDIYFDAKDYQIMVENVEEFVEEVNQNRVVAAVYNNLESISDFSGKDEIMEKLNEQYKKNIQKAQTYKKHISYLASILKNVDFLYALLKGAFLTTQLYEEGYRTSNDVDILLEVKDIDKCQKILKENGFQQGYLGDDGKFIPATRLEIMMSRMNFGETVPFYKMVEGMPLQIDLNFSLDYKQNAENEVISNMLKRTVEVEIKNETFRTLCPTDFLIHLCCHLYKEATTVNWVEDDRDLNLYKFSDINLFLHNYGTEAFYKELAEKIVQLDLQKECYYAIFYTGEIYKQVSQNPHYEMFLESIKPDNLSFLNQIIDPESGKLLSYDMTFEEWFFCKNKKEKLVEN